jgi:hypothetical protein
MPDATPSRVVIANGVRGMGTGLGRDGADAGELAVVGAASTAAARWPQSR